MLSIGAPVGVVDRIDQGADGRWSEKCWTGEAMFSVSSCNYDAWGFFGVPSSVASHLVVGCPPD